MKTVMTREIWGALTEEDKIRVAARGSRIVVRAEVNPGRRGTWGYIMVLGSGATWAKGDYPTQAAASIALADVIDPPVKPWICMSPPAGWRGMSCTCDKAPHICPACMAWAANGFRE